MPFPPMSGALKLVTPPPPSFPTKSDWFEARKSNCITIFTPKTHDIGTHFEKSRNDPQFPTLTKNIPWYHILVFKGSRPLPSTT